MATITIQYLLSETGRKASILAGDDGRRVQRLTVEATPEALACATVDADGHALVHVGHAGAGYVNDWHPGTVTNQTVDGHTLPIVEYAAPQEPAALLAEATAIPARARANFAAAHLAEIARRADIEAKARASAATWAALPLGCRATAGGIGTCAHSGRPDDGHLYTSGTPIYDRRDLARYCPEALAEAQAESTRLEMAREAAMKDAHHAAVAAEAAEQEKWVVAFGSPRLRAALATGLLHRCHDIYLDERLTAERPGWEWESDRADPRAVCNPSLEQIEALAEARRLYPGVITLEYLYVPCDHGNCQGEAERECADTVTGRALRATFLGRDIYRWV